MEYLSNQKGKKMETQELRLCLFEIIDLLKEIKQILEEGKEKREEIKVETKEKESPYPAGHCWEGLTPSQISEAYKRLGEEKTNES